MVVVVWCAARTQHKVVGREAARGRELGGVEARHALENRRAALQVGTEYGLGPGRKEERLGRDADGREEVGCGAGRVKADEPPPRRGGAVGGRRGARVAVLELQVLASRKLVERQRGACRARAFRLVTTSGGGSPLWPKWRRNVSKPWKVAGDNCKSKPPHTFTVFEVGPAASTKGAGEGPATRRPARLLIKTLCKKRARRTGTRGFVASFF